MHANNADAGEDGIQCLRCDDKKEASEILELKCGHTYCWSCMDAYMRSNFNIKVKCPKEFCYEFLTDRDKRKILSEEDIAKYDNLCLTSNSKLYKCLLPKCEAFVSSKSPDFRYTCSSCSLFNCVACKAPHLDYTCKGFQSLPPLDKTNFCKAEIERATRVYEEKEKEQVRENILYIAKVDLVPTDRIIDCPICYLCIGKGDGVRLKNCGDEICRSCLAKEILKTPKVPPPCPACDESISEEEIQSVLSHDQLLKYRDLCANAAKRNLGSFFHCQALDCGTLHHTAATTTSFACTKCGAVNCVPCEAVHAGENCGQYQSRTSTDKNKQFMQEQIKNKGIWPCIACRTPLRKVSGCNWIQCSTCKSELCWINQTYRWGPKGRGDISGGCRCGVDGKPCHDNCVESCTPHDGNVLPLIESDHENSDNDDQDTGREADVESSPHVDSPGSVDAASRVEDESPKVETRSEPSSGRPSSTRRERCTIS